MAMSGAAVDSKAYFAKRVTALGLGGKWAKFEEFLWDTYGNFAYAVPVNATTGACDADAFNETVVRPLFEVASEAPIPPQAAALRRLFAEAQAMMLQDLKSRSERTDADPPRRLPQVEREARRLALDTRLAPAVQIDGDMEPAHAVVDRFVAMLEEDRIEHVPWGSVATRRAEVRNGPIRKRGADREASNATLLPTATNTHHEINMALQRRSVAVEMAGLMSWEAHERIRQRLLKALTESTGDAAYAPPSTARVHAADQWIWEQLSSKCSRGLSATTAADEHPADAAVTEVLSSYDLAIRLAPLPVSGAGGSSGGGGGGGAPAAQAKRPRNRGGQQLALTNGPPGVWDHPVLPAIRDAPANQGGRGRDGGGRDGGARDAGRKGNGAKGGNGKGGAGKGGKDGGKGRNDRAGNRRDPAYVPAQLQPGVGCDHAGRALCFRYNLPQGCTEAQPGEACARGLHLCTRIGCQGAHSATQCMR